MSQLCQHCGARLPDTVDAFCPFCRQRLDDPPRESEGATAMPPPPKTIIVDVPLPRLPLPSGLLIAGVLVTYAGFLLRRNARWLAWPRQWEYTGERVNTPWAYAEALYIDLGLLLMAFGLGLVFLKVVRYTGAKHPRDAA